MKKYGEKVLNELLNQYERSKSFTGDAERRQSFQKKVADLFRGYDDSANFELFTEVNAQIADLEQAGLIEAKRLKRGKIDSEVIESVKLISERMDACYEYLGRVPKADMNKEISRILRKYQDKTPLLQLFCTEQLDRLSKNKKVQYCDEIEKLELILKVLSEIEKIEEETYVRNFSIRVLGDSKAFEKIKSSVVSILFEYGDYPDKDTILEDLNIVKNPGYVYAKGNGTITVSGQAINLGKLDGAVGLSSELLDDIEKIEINASKVITIENLTTFHSYVDEEAFIIYLGGYHNSIRRKLICKIYRDNPYVKYYHYGDIDAGGFYILLDLRKKTGIPFEPLNMDAATIEKYNKYTKRLTENDRIRLSNLAESEFAEVIRYMLDNDCKLEQEAVE